MIAILAPKMFETLRERLATHSLVDTLEFISFVGKFNASCKYPVSFDIISLFTKFPLVGTVNVVCGHTDEVGTPTPTPKRLLFLCTKSIQFQ